MSEDVDILKHDVHAKVKWFNGDQGYGFVETEEFADAFVHFSSIVGEEGKFKSLTQGDEVLCDIGKNEKGYNALNVRKDDNVEVDP